MPGAGYLSAFIFKIILLFTLPSCQTVPGLKEPMIKGGHDGFDLYADTLPSLDSATMTPQIYPEGKLRCSAPVFEPGGGGINVARAITHLGGKATAIFPAGGATGEHLVALLADEQVAVDTVDAKDWTRQNLHVHVESSGEQYRFVMPGAKLSDDEFRQLDEKVLTIESGSLLVISGSLPPGVKTEKLTALVQAALQRGIRCIVDSSGEALKAALEPGQLELVKPNQKELSAWLIENSASLMTFVLPQKSWYVRAKRIALWSLSVLRVRWPSTRRALYRLCHRR